MEVYNEYQLSADSRLGRQFRDLGPRRKMVGVMNIKGYDAWKLSGPPEPDGPTCDMCGDWGEIRVECEGMYVKGRTLPPLMICADCFTGQDDGPCFDDLPLAADVEREQAEEYGDYLYQQ